MIGGPDIRGRLAALDEAERVWQRAGQPLRIRGGGWIEPARIRAGAHLELGELEEFDRLVALYRRMAEERHDWFSLACVISYESIRHQVAGRFAEAESLLAELVHVGGQHPDVGHHYASQLLWVLYEQGRVGELLPILRSAVDQNPGVPGFRCGLALALCEDGSSPELGDVVRSFGDDQFPAVPRDSQWKLSLALLAEPCARLGDRPRCARLLAELDPFAGQLACTGWGTVCVGSVDRHRAVLQTALGDLDAGDGLFRRAEALEERIEAPPLLARTLIWHARCLAARGAPGDGAESAELVRRSDEIRRDLGVPSLAATPAV
jgi:tetratricopeptide (TPR) repeat protein